MAEQAEWHLISGAWQRIEGEVRERLLGQMWERIQAHVSFADPSDLRVSRLELPFYRRRNKAGTVEGLDLYEIAIPEEGHLPRLERWCFVLWDGAGDLRQLRWTTDTLHDATTAWANDHEALATEQHESDRLEFYLRFFCAFLSLSGSATDDYRSPVLLAELDNDNSLTAPLEWRLYPRIALVRAEDDQASAWPRAWKTAEHYDVVIGEQHSRASFKVTRMPEGHIEVEMLDDKPGLQLERDGQTPWVQDWGDIAMLCRGVRATREVSILPIDFHRLASDPATRRSLQSGRLDSGVAADLKDALELCVQAAWGGPRPSEASRLRVNGSVDFKVAAVDTNAGVWFETPAGLSVEIAGDLDFTGSRINEAVSVSGLTIRGRLLGEGARFGSSLSLRRLRVENAYSLPSSSSISEPSQPHPIGVNFDSLRALGDVALDHLYAQGSVTLCRARIRGRLSLAQGDYRPRDVKGWALAADGMAVGASCDLTGLFSQGSITMTDARIANTLDLSGTVVIGIPVALPGSYAVGGIILRRGRIGGDLVINRQHQVDTLSDWRPTLIIGELDLSGIAVRSNLDIVCAHVSGKLWLTQARVNGDARISGLYCAPAYMSDAAPSLLHDLTVVGGDLELYYATIGGNLTLGALAVGEHLNAIGLRARVVRLGCIEEWFRLPVVIGRRTTDEPGAGELQLNRIRVESLLVYGVTAGSCKLRSADISKSIELCGGEMMMSSAEELADDLDALQRLWIAPDALLAPVEKALPFEATAAMVEALRSWLAKQSASPTRSPIAMKVTELVVDNLRTRGDLLCRDVNAVRCEVTDSVVAGNLTISGAGVPCEFNVLRLTGCRVGGEVSINGGAVFQTSIGTCDLSYSSVRRGIRVGSHEHPVRAVSWQCTGMTTDADVDLAHLTVGWGTSSQATEDTQGTALTGQASVAAGAKDGRPAASVVSRLPDAVAKARRDRAAELKAYRQRVWDDVSSTDEGTALELATAREGEIAGSHVRVGGVMTLPVGPKSVTAVRLQFLEAKLLSVSGGAFRDATETGRPMRTVLDLSSASVAALGLTKPLPRRANLQNCVARQWQVKASGNEDGISGDARDYLTLLDKSWPFAQEVYSRLESDYRDLGEQRVADAFLRRMGWRLWRWSYLRPFVQSALRVVDEQQENRGQALGRVMVPTVRAVIGVAFVAPLQFIYGFGVRWWLPLVFSTVLMLGVTWPMMRECANLATPSQAPLAATGGRGASCDFNTGKEVVTWTSGEAFWLSVQYHVPIIPLTSFYQGETSEAVRPVGKEAPWINGRPIDEYWWARWAQSIPGVQWVLDSPERYTRTIYLLSWLVVPFSLVFFAGRLQRKYRLQQG